MVANASLDPSIRAAAQDVATALKQAVIAETHAPIHPEATGLTLEASTSGVPEGYADTRFARETCWTEALEALREAAAEG